MPKCLALFLMICLLAGCAGGDDAYTAAVTGYFDALTRSDTGAMYAHLSESAAARIPENVFSERHHRIYGAMAAKNIAVEMTGIEKIRDLKEGATGGRRIAYRMTMDTVAGPITVNSAADVYDYPGSGAKIDWRPSMIFPDLTDDRPVRVDTKQARRGSIFDKNGALLAGEGTVKVIGFVPGKMRKDAPEDVTAAAKILAIPAAAITEKLAADWATDDVFVPFYEMKDDDAGKKAQLLLIPGIRIDDKRGRVYPHGEAIADEAAYADVLAGRDGHRIVITDARGDVLFVIAQQDAVDGKDVYLDIAVQSP